MASDLGLHCLSITYYGFLDYNGLISGLINQYLWLYNKLLYTADYLYVFLSDLGPFWYIKSYLSKTHSLILFNFCMLFATSSQGNELWADFKNTSFQHHLQELHFFVESGFIWLIWWSKILMGLNYVMLCFFVFFFYLLLCFFVVFFCVCVFLFYFSKN